MRLSLSEQGKQAVEKVSDSGNQNPTGTHYKHGFPEGRRKANEQFAKMKRVLAVAPLVGNPFGEAGSRYYSLRRAPFSVIYRVSSNKIEVLNLIDQRAERTDISARVPKRIAGALAKGK